MTDAAIAVKKLPLKQRLSALFAQYGSIAIWTYLAMSLLTIAAFAIVYGLGMQPTSATGVLGVIGAAWLTAKATMPIRIPIAIAITPVVARVVRRGKKAPDAAAAGALADADDDDDDDDDDD